MDGEGLCRARARHVRGGHRGARTRSSAQGEPRRPPPRHPRRSAGAALRGRREGYPRLQADENFRQLQDELAGTENRIAVSRQVYNDTVLSYNNAIQTFPGVVLAGQFSFEKREFFETDVTQREAPQVDFGADAAPAAPAAPPHRPQSRAQAAHPVVRRLSVLAAAAAAALTLRGSPRARPASSSRVTSRRACAPTARWPSTRPSPSLLRSFTYGFRESSCGTASASTRSASRGGRPFQPGGVDQTRARRTAGHVRRRGARRARPGRLAVQLGRLRATDVRDPLSDRGSRDRRRRRRQPQGLGRRMGAASRRLTATMRGPGNVVRAWGTRSGCAAT